MMKKATNWTMSRELCKNPLGQESEPACPSSRSPSPSNFFYRSPHGLGLPSAPLRPIQRTALLTSGDTPACHTSVAPRRQGAELLVWPQRVPRPPSPLPPCATCGWLATPRPPAECTGWMSPGPQVPRCGLVRGKPGQN